MTDEAPWSDRFKQARERAGLSVNEAAKRMGIPAGGVCDIESYPDELFFARVPCFRE